MGPAKPIPAAATKASKSARTVLGSKVLGEYQSDWDSTIVPDGWDKAPRMLGYISQGKLKADELRMAFHVHFVITLVRLWGEEATGRYHDLLANFVSLVVATSLISRYSTNADRQASIQTELIRYLDTLLKLFPQEELHPNHHLVLHLVELLVLYGPPSAWWAFPFERYIGILRKINTNNKFCESLNCICSAAQFLMYTLQRISSTVC